MNIEKIKKNDAARSFGTSKNNFIFIEYPNRKQALN